MPQQLVAKDNGHKELLLAQLITLSKVLTTIPPPGVSWIIPGKGGLPAMFSFNSI
jgi:hypothetical protein